MCTATFANCKRFVQVHVISVDHNSVGVRFVQVNMAKVPIAFKLLFYFIFWDRRPTCQRQSTWGNWPPSIFGQVERRFHNRESNRQPLPWGLGISPPSSSRLMSSGTTFKLLCEWPKMVWTKTSVFVGWWWPLIRHNMRRRGSIIGADPTYGWPHYLMCTE